MKYIKTAFLIALTTVVMTGCGSKPTDNKNSETENVTESVTSQQISETIGYVELGINETRESIIENMSESQSPKEGELDSLKITSPTEAKEPKDDEYVRILDYIPDMIIDLKYATADNFTGQIIYDFTDGYLRYGTVKKLAKVQESLKNMGYRLKIWDAYRPFFAQERLWEVYPNPNYVANPANGMKAHNLGGTVDITMVALDGSEIPMPTAFDDFSKKADRDYSDIEDNEAVKNVTILQQAMYDRGFEGEVDEWWDYSDTTLYEAVEFNPPKS